MEQRGLRGYSEHIGGLLAALEGREGAPVASLGGPCATCGVEVQVLEDVDCKPCYASRPERLAAETILKQIPDGFRARVGSPELARLVRHDVSPATIGRILQHTRVTFRGPLKSGKTALAAACFRHFVEMRRPGWRGAWFVDADLLGRARAEHPLGSIVAAVERAKGVPFLVIDDLGSESVTENQACLKDILSFRHARNRRTWVTTGLTRDQLEARPDYGGKMRRRTFVDDDGESDDPLLLVLELGKESVHRAR